jgi:hypothetical protein
MLKDVEESKQSTQDKGSPSITTEDNKAKRNGDKKAKRASAAILKETLKAREESIKVEAAVEAKREERSKRESMALLLKNYKIFCKDIMKGDTQGGWAWHEYLKNIEPSSPWLNEGPSCKSLVGPLETVKSCLLDSRTLKEKTLKVEYQRVIGSDDRMPLKVMMALLSQVGDTQKGGRILVLNGHLLYSSIWFTDREGLIMLLASHGKGYGLGGKELYRREISRGLCSWTTRGQISAEMKLKACTGLRTSDMTIDEAQQLISEDGGKLLGKDIDFVTSSLRSAVDLVKYKEDVRKTKIRKITREDGSTVLEQTRDGLHVTMLYKDQTFGVKYNNCRRVLDESDPQYDWSVPSGLLQTRPWKSIEESLLVRKVSQLARGTGMYSKTTGVSFQKAYKSYAELGIRAFIKDVVNNRNGVRFSMFTGYADIVDFIDLWLKGNKVKVGRKIDVSYISNIKYMSRGKLPKRKTLPDLPVVRSFLLYVKSRFCNYDPSVLLVEDKSGLLAKDLELYKEKGLIYTWGKTYHSGI